MTDQAAIDCAADIYARWRQDISPGPVPAIDAGPYQASFDNGRMFMPRVIDALVAGGHYVPASNAKDALRIWKERDAAIERAEAAEARVAEVNDEWEHAAQRAFAAEARVTTFDEIMQLASALEARCNDERARGDAAVALANLVVGIPDTGGHANWCMKDDGDGCPCGWLNVADAKAAARAFLEAEGQA